MGAATIRRNREEAIAKGLLKPRRNTSPVTRREHEHAMADQRIEHAKEVASLKKQLAAAKLAPAETPKPVKADEAPAAKSEASPKSDDDTKPAIKGGGKGGAKKRK